MSLNINYDLNCPTAPVSPVVCPEGCVDAMVSCHNAQGAINNALQLSNPAIWLRYILPAAVLTAAATWLVARRSIKKGK